MNLKYCILVGLLVVGQVSSSFFSFTKSVNKEAETEVSGVRGVPPYALSKYESEVLTCDDGAKTYTKTELNDGYCDCVDGSDEPGTSACAGNTFHCINRGYRITQIPTSRVDDGVCDCCDGSDEGTLVKCANTCAAAAVKEKLMIEKVTAAYKIGSLVRADDIKSIEKAKAALLSEVEPLKIAIDDQIKIVEKNRETKNEVEKLHSESTVRTTDEVTLTAENLLGLPGMPELQLAQFLSSLLTVCDMNDDDVKIVLREASIEPFESTVATSPIPATHQGDDDSEIEADAESYGEGDDIPRPTEVEEDEKSGEQEVQEAAVVPATPFHCTLLQHVNDPRLQYLCNHKPSSEESLLADEQAAASLLAVKNVNQLILQLVKSYGKTSELQMLIGHHRLTGSYDGAVDFIKSHKELPDPDSCPAAWANLEGVNDVCGINEKLIKLVQSITSLPALDTQPQIDLAVSEQDLKEMRKKLSKSETELSDINEYSEHLEYLALKDKCFDGLDGKFTYSVCILDKLTQRDGDDSSTEVTLGTFSSIQNNTKTGGIIMHFTEGTNCWAFGPRTADVFITCGPEHKILSSSEPTTCYYTFEVESPSGCTEKFAQINGIL